MKVMCSKVVAMNVEAKEILRKVVMKWDIEELQVYDFLSWEYVSSDIDLVITTAGAGADITQEYCNKVVMIADEEDNNYLDYCSRYRNVANEDNLLPCLYVEKTCKTKIFKKDVTLPQILEGLPCCKVVVGDYDFDFARGEYFYKGEGIYIPMMFQKFLAMWLLRGQRDATRRAVVYKLQQKFGKDFLREFDKKTGKYNV